MVYSIKKVDLKNSVNYKVYVERKNGKLISPLHDIPLNVNIDQQIFNMVVEIPRWSNTKWEISKKEKWNPIVQSAEKVGQGFAKTGSAHKGCFRNYGVFPQTCQLSNQAHPVIKTVGEHSPLDVLDIAEAIAYTGQVKKVKVLGVLELADEDKRDWKVIVIDVADPLSSKLNDIKDVERQMPGFFEAANSFFGVCEAVNGEGNPPVSLFWCKNYALTLIRKCNKAWRKSMRNKVDLGNIALTDTTLKDAEPCTISADSLNFSTSTSTKDKPI